MIRMRVLAVLLAACSAACAAVRPPDLADATNGHSIALAVVTLLIAFVRGDSRAGAQASNGNALWQIVSTCVDHKAGPYCACPAFLRSCCGDVETPDADVVWARTDDFVAIRDMLMCGCKRSFVAGLALPLARVTGIGDPRRPEGIWPFAWKVARSRIADELEIGLVINPRDARTQNQMHVHMLRLRRRLSPLALAIRTVRSRGYLLERAAASEAVHA